MVDSDGASFIEEIEMLFTVVRRGKRAGLRLFPHRFEDVGMA